MDVKRLLSLIALLPLASLSTAAERAPVVAPAGGYVYRLSSDGDILAAFPSDGSDRSAYLLLAPLEPRPETSQQVATGVAGILTLPAGETGRVSIGANQQWIMSRPPAAGAPWCGELGGWQALSDPAGECLVPAGNTTELQPAIGRRQFDLAYSTERFDLALAYGVTNVSASSSTWALPGTSLGDELSPLGLGYAGALPVTSFPGLTTLGQDVSLVGTWRWTPGSALSVIAGVGQTSLAGANPLPLEFEHAALGLGLSRGAFTGRVTGRMVRPNALGGLDQPWSGLDIGISWRTPWRGELSFGARNLISRGTEPRLADPTTAELEQAVTRTPYVQYKQDL